MRKNYMRGQKAFKTLWKDRLEDLNKYRHTKFLSRKTQHYKDLINSPSVNLMGFQAKKLLVFVFLDVLYIYIYMCVCVFIYIYLFI